MHKRREVYVIATSVKEATVATSLESVKSETSAREEISIIAVKSLMVLTSVESATELAYF